MHSPTHTQFCRAPTNCQHCLCAAYAERHTKKPQASRRPLKAYAALDEELELLDELPDEEELELGAAAALAIATATFAFGFGLAFAACLFAPG